MSSGARRCGRGDISRNGGLRQRKQGPPQRRRDAEEDTSGRIPLRLGVSAVYSLSFADGDAADFDPVLRIREAQRDGLAFFFGAAEVGDEGGLESGGADEFLVAVAVEVGLDLV